MGVTDMGREFERQCLLPVLNSGLLVTTFNLLVNMPTDRHLLKSIISEVYRLLQLFVRISELMLSGP